MTTCCAQRASLKISKRGTQFFAHIESAGCSSGRETRNHLEAKMAMVRGALAAGWAASTEVRLGGGDAVADVLAECGDRRVALEAQWSRATLTDLQGRQRRYAAHGVRGAWFLRHGRIDVSKELPAFVLSFEEDTPMVVLDDRRYALEAFTTLLLEGRAQYRTSYEATGVVEVEVRSLTGTCSRCGARAELPSELSFGPVLSACGHVLRRAGAWDARDECFEWWRGVAEPLAVSALRSRGQPVLARVAAHPPGKPFLSLVSGGFCPRCGEGKVYRHRAVSEHVISVATPVPDLRLQVPHWCVDFGSGHCRQQ